MKLGEAKTIALTDKERKRNNLDESITRTIGDLIDTIETIRHSEWPIENKAEYLKRQLRDSMRMIEECADALEKAEEIARIFKNIEG